MEHVWATSHVVLFSSIVLMSSLRIYNVNSHEKERMLTKRAFPNFWLVCMLYIKWWVDFSLNMLAFYIIQNSTHLFSVGIRWLYVVNELRKLEISILYFLFLFLYWEMCHKRCNSGPHLWCQEDHFFLFLLLLASPCDCQTRLKFISPSRLPSSPTLIWSWLGLCGCLIWSLLKVKKEPLHSTGLGWGQEVTIWHFAKAFANSCVRLWPATGASCSFFFLSM